MKARKLYVRWKHRRMIRRAWPLWYVEHGSIHRHMWRWRRERGGQSFPSVAEAMAEFSRVTGKVS